MTITVSNLRLTETGIRCDRSSVLGNPFHMRSPSERLLVIQSFRKYLWLVAVKQKEPSVAVAQIKLTDRVDLCSTWKRSTSIQIRTELDRISNLSRSQDLTLLCWCAPLACHCDVLVNYFNWHQAEFDRSLINSLSIIVE